MPALVSVVFDPGHDEELRTASLASVEAQTHPSWEIVDGLAAATGEYVAFLDAADVWVPERLARLVAAGAPVVADQLEGIRGNGQTEVFGQPRPTEATRLMFRRDVLVDGGGIDPEAGAAWVLDFLLRNPADPGRAGPGGGCPAPVPGPTPRRRGSARKRPPRSS